MLLRARRNDRGYVLALTALMMTSLMTLAGFGIDLGNWYINVAKVQRTADAAALAGAAKMPDTAAAIRVAHEAAAKNGYVDDTNGVEVTAIPEPPNRMRVSITDTLVETVFASFVLDHVSVERTSRAEFLEPTPMGSPFNILGTGELSVGPSIPRQNYWLAVNGWCSAKEDGDLFLSAYDGNKGTATSATQCNGPEVNSDYDADGYDYIVDVPVEHTAPVTIGVYDAAFAPGSSGSLGQSPDASGARQLDAAAQVDTTYRVFDTRNTDQVDDDTLLATELFTTNDTKANAIGSWRALTTVPGGLSGAASKYRVQVTTSRGQPRSYGVNAFALRATSTTHPTNACDTRTQPTCPQVYGRKAMSVFANLSPSSGRLVDFYLTDISTAHTGRELQISLWDPGEGGDSIQLLAPNNAVMPFTWSATPNGGGMSGTTFTLPVGGTGPQPGPNRGSQYRYNDRLIQISVRIPSNYESFLGPNGDRWWKIRYNLPSSGTPSDRTTWTATVDGAEPVHLLRYQG